MAKNKLKRILVATKKEFKKIPMKQYMHGEQVFLISKIGNEFHAVDGICTHEYFPLVDGTLKKNVVTCAMHGASFDVQTGKVKALPAVKPLKTYQVEVVGEKIFLLR